MKLLIQPDDGIAALLSGIRSAKKSIEIVIFRFDRAEIEAGLKAAVGRGVSVSALIAYTNRGGEINLRKLEMRLLEVGVAVSRTADDLVRYHDKLMIIDRRLLYVLSFNFTHLDIDHSRGFGIVTRNARFVQEAVKLFEADTTRKPYTPTLDTFVVSPANARKVLGAFIRKAKKELAHLRPQDRRHGNAARPQRAREGGGGNQSHRPRRQAKPGSGSPESRQPALAHAHHHPRPPIRPLWAARACARPNWIRAAKSA